MRPFPAASANTLAIFGRNASLHSAGDPRREQELCATHSHGVNQFCFVQHSVIVHFGRASHTKAFWTILCSNHSIPSTCAVLSAFTASSLFIQCCLSDKQLPPQPFSFSYPHRQGEMRLAVSTAAAAVCCCCCCCWLLHTLFYIIWVCWADGRLTTARGICVMPHDDNKCVCLYCILYTYYGTSTATKTKWCEASWTKANKEKKNISKLCSTCCPNALP